MYYYPIHQPLFNIPNPSAYAQYYDRTYPLKHPFSDYYRQQNIKGTATWTTGGPVTECGIPWSTNSYMTVAVSEGSPFKCGEKLKITNLSSPQPNEVTVLIVDKVRGLAGNQLNLHRNAFEALGSPASVGVINVKFQKVQQPLDPEEYAKWGRTALNFVKNAYPNYNVVDYQFAGSEIINANQKRETFNFTLQSGQQKREVTAIVTFNPNTEEVISVNFANS